jgi:hypothetical protein
VTVTYPGRIEARIAVPTGGAAVSCATSTQSSAATATVAAGNYFYTAAGGVSSITSALQTALTTAAPPSSGSWSVALSTTTGLVTISCTQPAYVQFTSTDLRDLLGFAYDFDYPQTAAQTSAALGITAAEWEAGYLCNESSGNLSAAFGGVTLTASGTPTYLNQGPRGGADKAIGFDTANDLFSNATVFDVGASEDLAILVVAKFSTIAGNADILGRGWSGGTGYILIREGTSVNLYVRDGVDQAVAGATVAANNWYVIFGAMERSTNTLRIAAVPVTTGSTSVSSSVSTSLVGSLSNASAFKLGDNSTATTGGMTIAALYMSSATGAATGVSANVSTAAASFVAAMKSQTGTQHARGVWLPDCPLAIASGPTQAPRVTDLRQSESPTGIVLGLAGNSKYRHRQLSWGAVPPARVWESQATYAYGSWESFLKDTQFGMGHSWFTPSSRVQVHFSSAGVDTAVGSAFNSNAGISGWFVKGISSCEPSQLVANWDGLYKIEIPELVSDG